ncbi:hypothetical protein [Capnocytophaga stomatis]|uniref:DUF2262 domain-containing protein n=1 Tax=Capnocytophaga stomatis TaxID=1848904 RepID=A0A250FXJ5_9FLAO|nr:hypothetical protein [Capnocytophaga stomatis]ATA89185.1 hypothetical protein CGC58_05285 [Capnocytophaga stomatis]GIJ94015.1 hypothetical protein CAPN002_12330 [Capnocytophaga stomatis]GIJ96778.1 hypothetical protein CAPN001_13470 [Capnocytophaga stomatis]GIM48595.1 hypothetical protein CAPN003_00470 [Capnocytophaga stomatis]
MKSLTINDLKDNQATVLFNEKPLTLVLEPDGEPIESTLKLVNSLIPKLKEMDAKAKNYLAKECLDTYNDEIRKGDEPTLDLLSFENQLVLDEISFVGDELMLFFYKGILADFTWMTSSSDGENFDEFDILT